MKSKWVFTIEKLNSYCIGEDENIYRKPLLKGKRAFSARQISKQKPNRYRLNNEWWSEKQLRKLVKLDLSPFEIKKESDTYF